ncbi:CAP domain-containing protein [Albidovulum sp.]
MRRTQLPAALAVAIGLSLWPAIVAAAACAPAAVPGAAQVIGGAGINQALADAAIRAEVNRQRCRAGLPPVAGSAALAAPAARHAGWMARSRRLGHKSTLSGQATPMARLKSSGLRFRAGSENVGLIARYRIDGMSFRIRDAAACRFATQAGAPIGEHSYASLARTIVDLWMASPPHRRNILDPKVKLLGSGVGFDPAAEYCGRYYVSQLFAG